MKRLDILDIIVKLAIVLSALLFIAPLVRGVISAYSFPINRVDSKWNGLSETVSIYVAGMADPDKENLCKELVTVYTNASMSDTGFNETVDEVRQQSRRILMFEGTEPITLAHQHEWQSLFGPDGVIMIWLRDNNITVSDSNKKQFFLAIAKGLQQPIKPVKEAQLL